MKEKVVVGLSGGVDSSVAAYLLKEMGYDVIGVTMQIWQNDACDILSENSCCGLTAVEDARKVAETLDIPYYVLNFREVFKEKVIDYFVETYLKGKTPNPCIACNRYVKWESLLTKALKIDAEYIATGHYAKIDYLENEKRYALRQAKTLQKDQTYALYNLSQFQLEHSLMPLGDYSKDEVRELAEKIGLSVAKKPDSQEICFIPDNDYGGFIKDTTGIEVREGNFVDVSGKILGRHKGIFNYTIGQRRGLGVSFLQPMFVKEIRTDTNEIVLSENDGLFENKLMIEDINLMSIEKLDSPIRLNGKIRYNQQPSPCVIEKVGEKILCTFDNPQRAITKGQSAVFYDGDLLVCGGTIC